MILRQNSGRDPDAAVGNGAHISHEIQGIGGIVVLSDTGPGQVASLGGCNIHFPHGGSDAVHRKSGIEAGFFGVFL
ncbi:hypothetical protein SDC9_167698 [bioreactor metagenome]|uniref:Uncharacterized protein n=1 Tax=bioreactor metagenome TaxID=1076179 RepID=A0A645G335_9ZZZZ